MSVTPQVFRNITEEKMAAPNNAYYVLTQAHAGLPNSVLFDAVANTWLTGKTTNNLSEGTNLYYTDARVKAYADTLYVPYTGAISNVNLGSKNLTTTGKGTFGNLLIHSITGYPLDVYTDYGGAGQDHAFAYDPSGYFMVSPDLVASWQYDIADYVKAFSNANSVMSAGSVVAQEGFYGATINSAFPAAFYSSADILVGNFLQLDTTEFGSDPLFYVDIDGNLTTTGTITGGAYKVGATAGIDATFSILDGDGETSHNFVFTKGILTSYSTS